MQDLQKTWFITFNYSNLQGLKAVPLGLLLLVVVYWANSQHGPASNLSLPILVSLGAAILYWWVDRYYKTRYGRVERTWKQTRAEYIVGILGCIVALPAIYVDLTHNYPVSMVGLVFALAFVVEYLRIHRLGRIAYFLWQMVISFVIVLGVNLLSIFGLDGWWQALGLRSHFLAVLVVTSLVIVIAGLCGHIYFTRQFPHSEG
jgi:hypothetical protein